LSSVFSHRPHDYTATVRSTSDLGFVDEVAFHKLLETSPPAVRRAAPAERRRELYECMREIALAR